MSSPLGMPSSTRSEKVRFKASLPASLSNSVPSMSTTMVSILPNRNRLRSALRLSLKTRVFLARPVTILASLKVLATSEVKAMQSPKLRHYVNLKAEEKPFIGVATLTWHGPVPVPGLGSHPRHHRVAAHQQPGPGHGAGHAGLRLNRPGIRQPLAVPPRGHAGRGHGLLPPRNQGTARLEGSQACAVPLRHPAGHGSHGGAQPPIAEKTCVEHPPGHAGHRLLLGGHGVAGIVRAPGKARLLHQEKRGPAG